MSEICFVPVDSASQIIVVVFVLVSDQSLQEGLPKPRRLNSWSGTQSTQVSLLSWGDFVCIEAEGKEEVVRDKEICNEQSILSWIRTVNYQITDVTLDH